MKNARALVVVILVLAITSACRGAMSIEEAKRVSVSKVHTCPTDCA